MKAKPHNKTLTTLEAHGDVRRVLTPEEGELIRCCLKAGELEEAGDYESARHVLSKWWPTESERPHTDGLHPLAAAELLLRAGTLTGRLVSAKLTKGAQAHSRELLEESFGLFERAGHAVKAAEARAELAWGLRRAGNFKGARYLLQQALAAIGDSADGYRTKAVILLRVAAAELESGDTAEALNILKEAAPLFKSCGDLVLMGKFHINFGLVLMMLGQETGREEFLESAVVQFRAAGYRFAQAQGKARRSFAQENTMRLIALTENNFGYVLFLLREFEDAAERLTRAYEVFTEMGDTGHAAEVRETQARLLLAQGQCEEAVRFAAEAVRAFEAGERPALLADALTTMGVAQARSSRFDESRKTLERAVEVAQAAGALEKAGLAVLSALEELRERLNFVEARGLYEQARLLLAETHHNGLLRRLEEAAHGILAAAPAWDSSAAMPAGCADCTPVGGILETPLTRAALQSSGSRSPVLIKGEDAEKRRLLARMIHEWSVASGLIVVVNCDDDENSPALRDYLGRGAHRAARGTLFLDEVQTMSRSNQERLLRLIRQGVIERVRTARQPERVEVRVVAGTSCDLSAKVASGLFLPELLEALSVSGLLSTPSVKALDEWSMLSGCLVKESLERCYPEGAKLPDAVAWLLRAPVAKAAGALARQLARMSAQVTLPDGYFPDPTGANATASVLDGAGEADAEAEERITLYEFLRRVEIRRVQEALEAVGWNRVEAAKRLGMKRQTLENRLINKYPELLRNGKRKPPGSGDAGNDIAA